MAAEKPTVSRTLLESLQKVKWLAHLPADALETIAQFSVLRTIRAGETIFCQGEPSPYCFGVVRGGVTIQRVSKDRRCPVKQLDVLEPGDLFGESSLFEDSPRVAMATASQDGELVGILGGRFRVWLQAHPVPGIPILMGLLQNSLERLSQTSNELAVIHGIGRLAGKSRPFREGLIEAVHFLKSSLDEVDDILFYQKSPYWDQFEPIALDTDHLKSLPLPSDSVMVKMAGASADAFTLNPDEARTWLAPAKLSFTDWASLAVVPLPDWEKENRPLQGFLIVASRRRVTAFPQEILRLPSTVAHPLSESLARVQPASAPEASHSKETPRPPSP
jgi:CRP/FNR family transcriptional regulator, cyclic AMP receptor protein